MSLNTYRDEAEDFLKRIGAENVGIEEMVKMLEEEFNILKDAIDNPDKLNHQIYDMLFLLFEMASSYGFDLEAEWNMGRDKKHRKYIEI